jgi:hypothetical protein
MSEIVYTSHAKAKFALLKRYGFDVAPEQVEETVLNPEEVAPQSAGKFVAQKTISAKHILRVVYREDGEKRIVITFYPGRKERYETKI